MRQISMFVAGTAAAAPAPELPIERRILFVGLNPADATAEKRDRTSDRCTAFALRWGGVGHEREERGHVLSPCGRFRYLLWTANGALMMVNLFAYRSPYPDSLRAEHDLWSKGMVTHDPIGPENDARLLEAAAKSDVVVCAWGNDGALGGRDQAVLALLAPHAHKLRALGFTAAGHPIHPQARGAHRVPDDVVLQPFPRRS
jgi:hypothetical protein